MTKLACETQGDIDQFIAPARLAQDGQGFVQADVGGTGLFSLLALLAFFGFYAVDDLGYLGRIHGFGLCLLVLTDRSQRFAGRQGVGMGIVIGAFSDSGLLTLNKCSGCTNSALSG